MESICYSQSLSIDTLYESALDLTARTKSVKDANGIYCALIKVAFPKVGAAFEGNVIGTAEYKAGEYWVYMTANSKYLKMKHAEYAPLMIQFDDNTVGPVESKRVYGVKVSAGAAKQPVTFKITPPNAILTVDQKECAMMNGIAEVMLSPEEHTYVVVAQGYNTQGGKFMVYENNTNKIIVELDPKGTTTSVPSVTPMVEQCEYGELTIDGDRYVGEHKNGKPHGRGVIIYDDTNLKSYEGDWLYGKRHGKGTLIWQDGARYEGEWENDDRNGVGTMIWEDGEKYVGEWKNGHRDGHGVFYYDNGDRYDGGWFNGKKSGSGTYYFASGDKEVANYSEGKENGIGTYYSVDGWYEKGNYIDGKEDGEHERYDENGKHIATRTYIKGELIRKKFYD